MNRAVVLYGCPTWPALGVRAASVNVHTLAGERPLAASTFQMLVSPVAVVSTDVVFIKCATNMASVNCIYSVKVIKDLYLWFQ